MPSQHRKHRGYESQRIVANYLRERGWPHARSIGAGESGADIVEVVDIAVEVKSRRNLNIAETLRQAEANAHGRLPFAVLRLDGQGPASIDEWPVVIRLGEFVRLLRAAGYGDGESSEYLRGYNDHARAAQHWQDTHGPYRQHGQGEGS